MNYIGIIILILLQFSGCASFSRVEPFFRVRPPASIGRIDPIRFEKSIDKHFDKPQAADLVTVRFEGVKVCLAVGIKQRPESEVNCEKNFFVSDNSTRNRVGSSLSFWLQFRLRRRGIYINHASDLTS